MVAIVTGKSAAIKIANKAHSVYGITDFSLSFSRDTIEEDLVGETGNLFLEGALSIDGSFTQCKFAASGNADALQSIINGSLITISGSVSGSNFLGFYFTSAQITGYDISIGDASTITEASIDFTVLNPYQATYDSSTGWVMA